MKKIEIKFSIHYSFLILIVLSIFTGQFFLILSYFGCLVAHEMVHAFFARKCGYKLGKIKLALGGALLEAEADEFSFKDEILIAISAPLFNLFLALIIIAFWWICPESYNYTLDLAVINIAIFAFNILPVFPLDGGRVLMGVLSQKMERKTAIKIAKSISVIFSILLFFIFVVSLFFTPLFAFAISSINLLISVISEDKKAVYKKAFFRERKKHLIDTKGMEEKCIYVSRKFSFLKLMTTVKLLQGLVKSILKSEFQRANIFLIKFISGKI